MLFLLMMPLLSTAAVSDASYADAPQTCSMRLSGKAITKDSYDEAGQGFCSGTLVGPKTMITAAHCLDDVTGGSFGDLDKGKSKGFFAAFNTSEKSLPVRTQKGDAAIFYSAGMGSQKIRSKFASEGDIKLINHDVVVLQLENAVEGYDAKVCPRLPTSTDCRELNAALANSTASQPAKLRTNFFKSKQMKTSSGLFTKNEFAPLPQVMPAAVLSAGVNSANGYLVAGFQSQSKVVHLRKGDSGSSMIFDSASGPVVIGVQSAVFKSNDASALFAQVCPKVTDQRWAQVNGTGNGVNGAQTASAEPLPVLPGQARRPSAQ